MHDQLKKKFSQNFLIDKNILYKISNLIKQSNLEILEIGPGNGALTEYILKSNPKNLTIIEIDKDLIDILNEKFIQFKNITIINDDFLKNENVLTKKFDLVVSNLPYNISSQILIKLAINKFRPKKMILMFQKEFGDRLLDKKLNSLNSIINCFYSVTRTFDISKNSFFPTPKIKSTIIEFNLLRNSLLMEPDIASYINFKRQIFNKKRKMLGSILKKNTRYKISPDILKKRAESLCLQSFIELFYKTSI